MATTKATNYAAANNTDVVCALAFSKSRTSRKVCVGLFWCSSLHNFTFHLHTHSPLSTYERVPFQKKGVQDSRKPGEGGDRFSNLFFHFSIKKNSFLEFPRIFRHRPSIQKETSDGQHKDWQVVTRGALFSCVSPHTFPERRIFVRTIGICCVGTGGSLVLNLHHFRDPLGKGEEEEEGEGALIHFPSGKEIL